MLPPAIPAAEPVLLYNGTGTSSDVSAVEAVLGTLGVGYATADSTQLNALSEPQLAADLNYAGTVIQSALTATSLPHF
jgi:hypothetical protein